MLRGWPSCPRTSSLLAASEARELKFLSQQTTPGDLNHHHKFQNLFPQEVYHDNCKSTWNLQSNLRVWGCWHHCRYLHKLSTWRTQSQNLVDMAVLLNSVHVVAVFLIIFFLVSCHLLKTWPDRKAHDSSHHTTLIELRAALFRIRIFKSKPTSENWVVEVTQVGNALDTASEVGPSCLQRKADYARWNKETPCMWVLDTVVRGRARGLDSFRAASSLPHLANSNSKKNAQKSTPPHLTGWLAMLSSIDNKSIVSFSTVLHECYLPG